MGASNSGKVRTVLFSQGHPWPNSFSYCTLNNVLLFEYTGIEFLVVKRPDLYDYITYACSIVF